MDGLEVIRAEEEWQRAGAYSVRIQGMNRQYHISLRDEFDEHDCDGTRYIVLLDDGYPIATCRFYSETAESNEAVTNKNETKASGCVSSSYQCSDGATVILGRVVVLPEYRGKKLGAKVVQEAEKWIKELGYKQIIIDSRKEVVGFYEKLGYKIVDGNVKQNSVFECVCMKKAL